MEPDRNGRSGGGSLVAFVAANRDSILAQWRARVKKIPSARKLRGSELSDHVPELLQAIAEHADDLAHREEAAFPEAVAGRHALQRLAEGYDLGEMMIEFSLLRDCLLRAWESRRVQPHVRSSIAMLNQAVDAAAMASVDRYASARDHTLQAVDRVSAAALESRSVDDLLRRILDVLVATTPAVDTAVFLLREDVFLRGRAAVGIAEAAARDLRIRLPEGPEVPHHGTACLDALDERMRREVPDLRAVHAVWIANGHEPMGALHLGSRAAFHFSDQDRHLFDAIASRAASAISQQLLRHEAERRAAELQAVIESIPSAIYIADEAGVVRSNRVGLEVLGLSTPGEPSVTLEARTGGLDPRDAATGERIPPEEVPLAIALRGTSNARDLLIRNATVDTDMYVHAIAAPIRDGATLVGAVVVNHDITRRKLVQDELRLSEERLLLALDVTKLGTWDWNVSTGQLVWSPRCHEIHGIAAGEPVSYDRFLGCVHREDRAAVDAAVTAALAPGGGECDVEYRVVLPDGDVRWVATRGRPFFDGRSPRAVRLIGTSHDVTRQKHDQESQRFLAEASHVLASSLDYRETLRRVAKLAVPRLADWCAVEIAVDGGPRQLVVEHVDPSKVEMARALRERYGLSPGAARGILHVLRTGRPELYGDISEDLLRESARDAEHARILRDLGLRSAMIVPLVARRRTMGVLLFVAAESGRRYDARDLSVAEDLATRAALALDNARLYEESLAAIRARDQILAVVSHDLRNPLGAMSMGTTVLQCLPCGQEPTAQKQLEAMQRSILRMDRLIEDLLDTASIQVGRLALDRQRHDAGALVREAVDAMEPRARERNVTLACENGLEGVDLSCDRHRFLQLFTNLLGNSIKFCRPGESVSLRAERSGSQARLVVADTGPGIHPDDLAHIFEPYWSSAAHVRRGTGLGLFICQGIVRAHGGDIHVSSEPGMGTTVEVWLPLGPSDRECRGVPGAGGGAGPAWRDYNPRCPDPDRTP